MIVVLICPAHLSAQGGRRILYLYGYVSQQVDGLSFPEDVSEPDKGNVAAVTLEVMVLRTEVDMLIKVCVFAHGWASAHQLISNFVLVVSFVQGSHPHPEHFREIIPSIILQVCRNHYSLFRHRSSDHTTAKPGIKNKRRMCVGEWLKVCGLLRIRPATLWLISLETNSRKTTSNLHLHFLQQSSQDNPWNHHQVSTQTHSLPVHV